MDVTSPVTAATEADKMVWPHHGITLVVMSPSGSVKTVQRFQTYNLGQSKLLLNFIKSLQSGRIVIFAAVVCVLIQMKT